MFNCVLCHLEVLTKAEVLALLVVVCIIIGELLSYRVLGLIKHDKGRMSFYR